MLTCTLFDQPPISNCDKKGNKPMQTVDIDGGLTNFFYNKGSEKKLFLELTGFRKLFWMIKSISQAKKVDKLSK